VAHFIWDERNTAHIGEHGVTPAEAEYVVAHARPPYPRQHGDDKLIARGQTRAGRYIQVIYVPVGDAMELDYTEVDLLALELESADSFYVIHARPLTSAERGPLKRRRKGKGR
jgi:uncharacterized DUF497 family protein